MDPNHLTGLPFANSHAFIIGIDAYTRVSPLSTAVSDAQTLALVLKNQQNFQVYPPLLNATGAEIRTLLRQTMPETVGKNDRVFFYFAGHGIAADGEDGPAGYLIPADGDPLDRQTFIPMQDLQEALDSLPCRHLLLVLDCCFSGAFQWSGRHRAIGGLMPKRIYKERFDRFILDPAWQVLTSAAYDQKALDVLEGKPTGDRGRVLWEGDDQKAHSPFALALFEGLAGAADAKIDQEGDGVITATELYAYIRDRVEPATIELSQKSRQTPGFFPLKKHDKGEYIFLHPRHRLNLPPIPRRNPYKGLAAFDETDRDLFYGRERVVRELRKKTGERKFIVVTGASGTGKSSVIKAGLLPRLRGQGFRILPVVRPGEHPVAALEAGFRDAPFFGKKISLAAGVTEALIKQLGSEQTVLLIDQYEELITRCSDAAERTAFVNILRRLLDATPPQALKIIITVRADFEPQVNGGPLAEDWRQGRYTVPPFTVEEFKEVIVMPTLQEVLIFDPPELVDEIIEEVIQSPGALPLLSYTLSELYEAYVASGRQDRALKKTDYDQLGGVMGALRHRADQLYLRLEHEAQSTMRKIMLRMVSIDEETAGKRVKMDDLIFPGAAENERVSAIVDQLVAARLVVKGEDYIEPAHDALVRAWGRLREWIQGAGRDKIILQNKVNAVANDYLTLNDENLLWSNDPRLDILRAELQSPGHWLNRKEMDFVEKSAALRERKKRRALTILTAVMLSLTGLTLWALLSRHQAIQNEKKSNANRLTIVANTLLGSDNTVAMRIAGSAYRMFGPASSARVQTTFSKAFHSQDEKPFYADNFPHRDPVNLAIFSPDGRHILTGTEGGRARLWQTNGDSLQTFDHHGYEVVDALFSPEGDRFLTLSGDDVVRLWRTGGRLLDSLLADFAVEHLEDHFAIAGDRIQALPGDPLTAALLDLTATEGEDETEFISPDGNRLIRQGFDGAAVLCTRNGEPLRSLGNPRLVRFSPDGQLILTVSDDGAIAFWNPEGAATGSFVYGEGANKEINQVSFSPDGRQFLTASQDHTAKLWDISATVRHRISRHQTR